MRLFKIVVLLLGMVACATSPLGRRQVLLMNDDQMSSLGAQSFEEMKRKVPIETDPGVQRYVQCVVRPIAEQARGRVAVSSWEVVVFKDPQVNAFALPGGKIGVYTGILPVARSASQLAAVLGHEVGHVIAKHGNERVSQGELTSLVLGVGEQALGTMKAADRNLILSGLGIGLTVGILLPFSRTQESEADLIGLDLMAKAGFDPNQSVELWKNMIQASGGKSGPEWMSTHPASERRITDLSAHIPDHLGDYQAALTRLGAPQCRLN